MAINTNATAPIQKTSRNRINCGVDPPPQENPPSKGNEIEVPISITDETAAIYLQEPSFSGMMDDLYATEQHAAEPAESPTPMNTSPPPAATGTKPQLLLSSTEPPSEPTHVEGPPQPPRDAVPHELPTPGYTMPPLSPPGSPNSDGWYLHDYPNDERLDYSYSTSHSHENDAEVSENEEAQSYANGNDYEPESPPEESFEPESPPEESAAPMDTSPLSSMSSANQLAAPVPGMVLLQAPQPTLWGVPLPSPHEDGFYIPPPSPRYPGFSRARVSEEEWYYWQDRRRLGAVRMHRRYARYQANALMGTVGSTALTADVIAEIRAIVSDERITYNLCGFKHTFEACEVCGYHRCSRCNSKFAPDKNAPPPCKCRGWRLIFEY